MILTLQSVHKKIKDISPRDVVRSRSHITWTKSRHSSISSAPDVHKARNFPNERASERNALRFICLSHITPILSMPQSIMLRRDVPSFQLLCCDLMLRVLHIWRLHTAQRWEGFKNTKFADKQYINNVDTGYGGQQMQTFKGSHIWMSP